MHQRAEFEPMQMACFAPYTVVTVLAEAALRLAGQRVSTAARLADRAWGLGWRGDLSVTLWLHPSSGFPGVWSPRVVSRYIRDGATARSQVSPALFGHSVLWLPEESLTVVGHVKTEYGTKILSREK